MPMWEHMSGDAIERAYLNGWRAGVQPGFDVINVEDGPLRDGMLQGRRDRREALKRAGSGMSPERRTP